MCHGRPASDRCSMSSWECSCWCTLVSAMLGAIVMRAASSRCWCRGASLEDHQATTLQQFQAPVKILDVVVCREALLHSQFRWGVQGLDTNCPEFENAGILFAK